MRNLGRLEEALAAFVTAVRLEPGYAAAHNNRAAMLKTLGRPQAAVAASEAALRLRPDFAEAHANRAAALIELDRAADALAACDAALRLRPDFAAAHANRSDALRKLNRWEEAVAAGDAALSIQPDLAVAHINRGNALRDLGRAEEALAAYDEALRIAPGYAEAHSNRGAALIDLARLDEALAAFERALILKPGYAEAHQNTSKAYLRLDRPDLAVAACDAAIEAEPDHADGRSHRGDALWAQGRVDEAIADFRAAEGAGLRAHDFRFNQAMLTLLKGDLANGWLNYEDRWLIKKPPPRALAAPFPIWRGEDLNGRTLIVYEEQGLGDVIQFCRYLKYLPDRGARVTFQAPAKLLALLRTLEGDFAMRTSPPADQTFDYQCPLLSLPLAFGTTLQTIPAPIPYMRAEPERILKWRDRLGGEGFKIGVAWQGSRMDIARWFPLGQLFGLSQLPGVRLISLQKDEEQAGDLPAGMSIETPGADFDAGPDAFVDSAAIMQSLDLVISCDTAVAHLAGALGRPVWLALKKVPEWRWQLDRTDSPWYPTMRLFRQHAFGDWRSVFGDIEAALTERLGGRSG